MNAARIGAPAEQSTGLSEAREADERERRAESLFLRSVMKWSGAKAALIILMMAEMLI